MSSEATAAAMASMFSGTWSLSNSGLKNCSTNRVVNEPSRKLLCVKTKRQKSKVVETPSISYSLSAFRVF